MNTVWVTRDEPPDGPLAAALRGQALEPLVEAVVERRVVADPAALVADLTADDWLVLTSPYAIEVVAQLPSARVPQVAVVGKSSEHKARDAGLRVALVGEDGHGARMFEQLRDVVRSGVVCYPRSGRATPPEPWADVDFRTPVLYDTQPRDFDRSVAERVALAAVASPSAVKALAGIDVPLASIGRSTSAAIRSLAREPVVEPAYPTFENLAAAIADYLRSSRHQRA